MPDLRLRCKVYPGQFSTEYAVSGEQVDGQPFSLFAPEPMVETSEAPDRDAPVDGWLRVSLYERLSDGAVVRLPRESMESGRFVTVSLDRLRGLPAEVVTAP